MNEAVKPRFAVDLDEIERQLGAAHRVPAPSAPGNRNDPLAELARIVGQDDPFQAILASDKARAAKQDPAGLDDLFVVPAGSDRSRNDLRGSYDVGPGPVAASPASYENPQLVQPAAHVHQVYDEAAYDRDGYDQTYYQDDGADPANPYPSVDESDYRPARSARSRKTVLAASAVIGTAILVGGGFMLSGRGPSLLSTGEPPLITANHEPTKVQPQSPGGVEIPNQNKQIYERAAQDGQTKVVNREEQPVDVREAIRNTAEGSHAAIAAGVPATTGGLNLGEPRKVRTVAIRPDGSVIGAAPAARNASPAPQQPSAGAPQAPATPAAPLAAASAPTPAQPRPAAATPSAAAPRMVLPATAAPTPSAPAGGSSPQGAATPVPSTPQRVASAQPIAVAPEPAAAPAAEAIGGFAVQLAVSASEAEARTAFGKLQQRYSDLGGQAALIRKAEVNGNTIYRVRVGPLARDEASSLCSKIQGQGGQCFVAKN